MATAELAVVLPAVLLVLAVALSALGLAIDQIRCVDAARAGARAAARGDTAGAVTQWRSGGSSRRGVATAVERGAGDRHGHAPGPPGGPGAAVAAAGSQRDRPAGVGGGGAVTAQPARWSRCTRSRAGSLAPPAPAHGVTAHT